MGGKWLRVQASPHSRQKNPKQKSEYKGCSGKICKDKKWVLCWGKGFPAGLSGKESTWQCRRHKRCEFDPWVRKIPWRRAWQPIPVFLPVESHRQRSLAGYSPWGSQRVWQDWPTKHIMHLWRKGKFHSLLLPPAGIMQRIIYLRVTLSWIFRGRSSVGAIK